VHLSHDRRFIKVRKSLGNHLTAPLPLHSGLGLEELEHTAQALGALGGLRFTDVLGVRSERDTTLVRERTVDEARKVAKAGALAACGGCRRGQAHG